MFRNTLKEKLAAGEVLIAIAFADLGKRLGHDNTGDSPGYTLYCIQSFV